MRSLWTWFLRLWKNIFRHGIVHEESAHVSESMIYDKGECLSEERLRYEKKIYEKKNDNRNAYYGNGVFCPIVRMREGFRGG